MEETTYSHHQHRETNQLRIRQPKVATILRSRSCRDREVLSKYRKDWFKT